MSPTRLSRIESAMRVVLAFNEAFIKHDVEEMMQHLSEDCVFEHSSPEPDGAVYKGKESVAKFLQELFREFPEAYIEIEEVFGLGRRCIMRWRYEWTNAEGQKGHIRGVDVFHVKDDLICERLSYVKG